MKKLLLFKKFIIVILLAGLSVAGWAQVVISQVYGGGGNTGATFKNDFIELFNRGTTPVTINGWSIQYASATGTSWTNMTSIPLTPMISIAPGQYYLIQEAAGTGGTVDLPTPDLIGTLALSGTNGKVALVNSTTVLSGACPTGASIIDFVGFGTTPNCFEGTGLTPAPSSTTSVIRASGGCTDTDNNASDFSAGIPTPRNSSSPLNVCSTVTPTISVTAPVTGAQWAQGSAQDFSWTASGTNPNVKIEFTADASSTTPTWLEAKSSIAANTGTWNSTIPADLPIGNDYQIRITDIPQTAVGLSGKFSVIAAPAPVATFNPVNAATGIDNTKDITITFDVPIRNIDNSDITDANVASLLTLTTTDALGTAVSFSAIIDASKKVITINPTADLSFEKVYYVSVAPVEGLSDNATIAQHISFTTVADLVHTINNIAITDVAPYYAGQTVTLTWASANVTAVKIEAWIPSQSKWEVLAASTPSDGTEIIPIPLDAQYSAGYKIRITEDGNVNVSSESSPFTIIAVVDNLLALRAQPEGAIVKYTGIATITYARTAYNQKYIQDATAAVLIHDPTTAPGFITGTYAIGDGITNIVGKISLYYQLIEFVPISQTGEHATGSVIVPEVRTLASLTTADQSKLVKIDNFSFKSPSQFDVNGKFVASKTYDIDGFDNTVIAYRTAFAESDYIGGFVPAGPISSIVLVGQYNALMQITSRSWSDITVPTVADFMADHTFVLTGENVNFTDMSSNHPTSWAWTFEGGTPATSTDQNPVVTYSAKGTFPVTLKATNAAGGTNTITKTDYISIGVVGLSTLESNVKVYPNPTNNWVNITNPTKDAQEIVIFNAVGKQVNSTVSSKDIISLNIASQSKGIYLIRITNRATNAVQNKKVVLY